MIVTHNPGSLPFDRLAGGSVVTIGTFDGVHLGHADLLQKLLEQSKRLGVLSVVMSFEPTPQEYFSQGSPPARLTCFREKFDVLEEYGIDMFFCPRFDRKMRDIEVETFIRQLLIHGLNASTLIVGDDFRFAKDRAGGIDELRRVGAAVDMEVIQVKSVMRDGERVSSTAIRNALADGNLDTARVLLGKPYRMSGKVIEGHKLGRELGFPTANFALNRQASPVMGVFAGRVSGIEDHPLDAVISVGSRPTFHGTRTLIESHIFDFDGDLYGKRIHVDFIAKLRDMLTFDGANDLVEQMNVDATEARAILAEDAVRIRPTHG
jgi:riboflavin kinase / FMN adenylyltransferase